MAHIIFERHDIADIRTGSGRNLNVAGGVGFHLVEINVTARDKDDIARGRASRTTRCDCDIIVRCLTLAQLNATAVLRFKFVGQRFGNRDLRLIKQANTRQVGPLDAHRPREAAHIGTMIIPAHNNACGICTRKINARLIGGQCGRNPDTSIGDRRGQSRQIDKACGGVADNIRAYRRLG